MIVTKELGAGKEEKCAYEDETQNSAREKCYKAEKAGKEVMQEEGSPNSATKKKDHVKEKQEKLQR